MFVMKLLQGLKLEQYPMSLIPITDHQLALQGPRTAVVPIYRYQQYLVGNNKMVKAQTVEGSVPEATARKFNNSILE
eukprot:TRINITY_DN4347_c0_g1_i1.p1 TRINITY_DN4347_c0_g1~~TRINITY_DN4347_c0_g1_i1.p1  ORF type:complete len:77 (-),score=8.87 TRINITY_DN4347_c0_g1_i1:99-329(-)